MRHRGTLGLVVLLMMATVAVGQPGIPVGPYVSSYIRTLLDDATALIAKGTLKLDHVYDIRDYGAVSGSGADDAAFTAASAAAGKGVVFIPAGTWNLTADFTIPEYQTWMGVGQQESILSIDSSNGTEILPSDWCRLERLKIIGDNTGNLIRNVDGEAYFKIIDCRLTGAETAIIPSNTWGIEISGGTFIANCSTAGISCDQTNGVADYDTTILLDHVSFYNCGVGFNVQGTAAAYAKGITIKACRFQTITGTAAITASRVINMAVENSWFENNDDDILATVATYELTIRNNTFPAVGVTDTPGAYTAIDLSSGNHYGTQISGNWFYALDTYNSETSPILLAATCENPLITSNKFEGDFTSLYTDASATDDMVVLGNYNVPNVIGQVAFAGKPWFDVTAFGAAGDGVTDDTAAIQAAINAAAAAGGGTVFVPAGTYLVSAGLSFEGKDNVALLLNPAAVIQADTGSFAIIYIGDDSSAAVTTNVSIRGGTLKGDKTDTQPWEARSGTTNGGIRIFAGRRIRISDVNFVDIYASGIDIDDSSVGDPCDIVISGCSFYNMGYHGIGMSECSVVIVSDCYMDRIGHKDTGAGTYHGMGIDFSTNSTNCRASSIQISRANYGGKSEGTNCSVFNLTATDLGEDGIILAGSGHRWTNCRFSWRDSDRATACRPVSGGGSDNTVIGCEFDDTYYELDIDGDRISLIGCSLTQNEDDTSAYYGIRIEDGEDVTISGCQIVANRTTAGAIYNNAPGTVLVGNSISTTTGASAVVHGSLATGTIVQANTLEATTYAQDYHASSTGSTIGNVSSKPDDPAGAWSVRPFAVANGSTSAGYIDIYEDSDDDTQKIRIQAQAMAGDITLTLPPDDGDSGEVLQTDGSGNLTWEAASGAADDTAYDATSWNDNMDAATKNAIRDKFESLGGGGFDATALDDLTWSDNANAANTWTFNVSGTDTTMIFGSAMLSLSHDLTVTGSDILLGAAGMKLTGDGDGAITFLGLGDGFDEDLTLNLDDTENTGTFTSSTGLATLNFSSIALQESGVNVLNNDEIDASAELYAIMDDETGSGAGALLVFNQAPQIDSIELGNASDTTIARSGAGAVTIEGTAIVMSGGAFHDGFSDFVANEHIDWTSDQGATDIHSGNIPDLSGTYLTAETGDISAVWGDDTGDVSALTAVAGDTLNATDADSTIPWKVNATAAPTTEGATIWESDADRLRIGDGAATLTVAMTADKLSAFAATTVAELMGVLSDENAGTDIAADLEEEAHAAEHAVSAADTVFPADPDADRYLMWDDDPGALVWASVSGGGDMAKATYDVADNGIVDKVDVTDDESTDDNHEVVFTTDNAVLESDGDFHYNPNTGTVTATTFAGALSGNATTATTAGAGDSATDFFGAGVSAATAGGAFHDGFSDFVANEHIDWTGDQGATDIHAGNIPDLSGTYLTAETDPSALLTAGTDNVKDTHIDWGTGAGQVSIADLSGSQVAPAVTIDFGGADDLEVPNGANPTVDTAGQIAVDSDDNTVRFYGDATYSLPGLQSKSFVIWAPEDTHDMPLWRVPYAITIRAVHVCCVGGTSVVGHLTECDANGGSAAGVDGATDITGTNGSNVDDDGALSNPSIDASDYLGWRTTTVNGEATSVTVTFDFTVDLVD